MPDNSTLPATNDIIRDVQKGGAAGPKTQVMVIDRGGSGAEDLSPLDGTDITTPTAMPAGGVGLRGWLSAIWTKLNGILSVVVTSNGLVSSVNSSAVALGLGAVFTGTSEDITEYADVRVYVFANQASATDGLQMQQSSNGTNWDVIDSYTVPASTGKTYSVGVSAKFFRVMYTNGGVASTVFRLQTKYHKTYSKGSSVRPQDARANDNNMEEQLAHLMGYNGVSWDRLRSSTANGLAVDVSRIVAALPAGANALGSVSVSNFPATQAVSGPLTDTQLRATAVPVSAASLPLPAGASTEATLAALNTKVTAVNTGAVVMAAGTASIGTVQQTAITKGTQGTTGITTQDLKDAGRNAVTYYMVIPVLTSATDTLQSLTGTKAGATVTATTTPDVVTTGKTLRITRLAATYIATTVTGYGIVRLRFNSAGVVAITSPVAATMAVGAGTSNAANSTGMEQATLGDGWEFAAGTGIGISAQGFAAATATAVGYVMVSVTGFEY